jgi:hypothetical protein
MSRQLWDVDGAPARKEVVAAWTWRRRCSHVAQRVHAPVPPRSCQEGGRGSHAAERLHDLCIGRPNGVGAVPNQAWTNVGNA